MPIFSNKLLSNYVRISKGLPPLHVYNTRIIWKRTDIRTSVDRNRKFKRKRKKKKWLPWHIYRASLFRRKYYKTIPYNVEQYYRNVSVKKKYRLRMWRLPYLYTRLLWEEPLNLKRLKTWLSSYRLPIMFRRFYRGYHMSRHTYVHKLKFRRLRAFLRENNPRVYYKYMSSKHVSQIRRAPNSVNATAYRRKKKRTITCGSYSSVSLITLLSNVLYTDMNPNTQCVPRVSRQVIKRYITSIVNACRSRGVFFGRQNWTIAVLKALFKFFSKSQSLSGIGQRLHNLITHVHNHKSSNRYICRDTLSIVPRVSKKAIARKFRRYTAWRSGRHIRRCIHRRCSVLQLRDASIQLKLRKHTFFSDLFYYVRKVRTLLNLSILWCDWPLFCSQRKYYGVHRTLFFFRCVYFSEISRGLRMYYKDNFKVLPILADEHRIHNVHMVDTINIHTLSFIIKYMYLDFLHSFMVTHAVNQRWVSQTFLLSMLLSVSKKYIGHSFIGLLNRHSIRLMFLHFVTGYTYKKPSRLLYVLHNTANSTFFLFWIIQLYMCINHKIRLCSIIKQSFILLYNKSNHITTIVDTFIFMFLKIINFVTNMHRSRYLPSDKYYIITSFVFNSNIENFRILNVANNLCLIILRMNTDLLQLREILFRYSVRLFTHQIEYTLFSFTKVPYFFFARYYYNTIPPLTNARMLCNYIIIKIAAGSKIQEAFDGVYTWQTYWKNKMEREYLSYITNRSNCDELDLREFVYPVKGIRIICSGPSYKARRTTAVKYLVWVSDEYLTGKMSLSTINLSIEYVQSHVVLRRSIIGIKVWLLFEEEVKFK